MHCVLAPNNDGQNAANPLQYLPFPAIHNEIDI